MRTMADLAPSDFDESRFRQSNIANSQRNYGIAKRNAERNYDRNKGGFFSNLARGISGGGWSKNNYLKKKGFTDSAQKAADAGYFDNSTAGAFQNRTLQGNLRRSKDLAQGRDLFRGLDDVPLVGGLISGVASAPAQLLVAGKDLAHGATSGDWSRWNQRDRMSDLGALGETALDIATAGARGKAKGLLGAVAKPAALSAGFGALDTLREQGEDATWGSVGMNAGIAGLMGAGFGGLGYGLGKAGNAYRQGMNKRIANSDWAEAMRKGSMSPDKGLVPISKVRNAQDEFNLQNAYRTLGISPEDSLKDVKMARNAQAKKFHPDRTGGDDTKFKAIQQAYETIMGADNQNLPPAMKNPTPASLSHDQIERNLQGWGYDPARMGQMRKQAVKDARRSMFNDARSSMQAHVPMRLDKLLHSPVGKAGAGVAGGLLIGNLLKGGRAPEEEQTAQEDEDYLKLLTYIYGGQ